MIYTQKFWIAYDKQKGWTRFLWFTAYVVIPSSIAQIITKESVAFIIVAGLIALNRHLSMRNVKNEY